MNKKESAVVIAARDLVAFWASRCFNARALKACEDALVEAVGALDAEAVGKKFMVVGGVYKTTDFVDVVPGTEECYGPFDTYQAAYDKWRERFFARVDDAHHRVKIVAAPR